MIEVAQPSSRNHPVVYRQGQGNHVWMGGGMYVCTLSPDSALSPDKTTYKPAWQVKRCQERIMPTKFASY